MLLPSGAPDTVSQNLLIHLPVSCSDCAQYVSAGAVERGVLLSGSVALLCAIEPSEPSNIQVQLVKGLIVVWPVERLC